MDRQLTPISAEMRKDLAKTSSTRLATGMEDEEEEVLMPALVRRLMSSGRRDDSAP
jgi:hypothetical protein